MLGGHRFLDRVSIKKQIRLFLFAVVFHFFGNHAKKIVFKNIPALFACEISFVQIGQHFYGNQMPFGHSVQQSVIITIWRINDIFQCLYLVDIDIQLTVGATNHLEGQNAQSFQNAKDYIILLYSLAGVVDQVELSVSGLIFYFMKPCFDPREIGVDGNVKLIFGTSALCCFFLCDWCACPCKNICRPNLFFQSCRF